MSYAEASYFNGAHFAHIAAWEERQRVARILHAAQTARYSERRVLKLRHSA